MLGVFYFFLLLLLVSFEKKTFLSLFPSFSFTPHFFHPFSLSFLFPGNSYSSPLFFLFHFSPPRFFPVPCFYPTPPPSRRQPPFAGNPRRTTRVCRRPCTAPPSAARPPPFPLAPPLSPLLRCLPPHPRRRRRPSPPPAPPVPSPPTHLRRPATSSSQPPSPTSSAHQTSSAALRRSPPPRTSPPPATPSPTHHLFKTRKSMGTKRPIFANKAEEEVIEEEETERGSSSEEEEELERQLADVPIGELQKALADGSSAPFLHKNAVDLRPRRANKNRPAEISTKVPLKRLREVVQAPKKAFRDPRFESLCGKLDQDGFRKRYNFLYESELPAEKKKLVCMIKKTKDPKVVAELQNHVLWIDKQLKSGVGSSKSADAKILAEHKKKEREATKHGKRPFYLKKSEIRKRRLVEKYGELEASGKLESYIDKRRRKNASKDHRYIPYRRPTSG